MDEINVLRVMQNDARRQLIGRAESILADADNNISSYVVLEKLDAVGIRPYFSFDIMDRIHALQEHRVVAYGRRRHHRRSCASCGSDIPPHSGVVSTCSNERVDFCSVRCLGNSRQLCSAERA